MMWHSVTLFVYVTLLHNDTHMNESRRAYRRVWHTTRSHAPLFSMCATLLYVRRDSFVCVTLCDSFVCATWLILMCDMHPYARVKPQIWTSPVAHMNKQCHTYGWVTSHIQKRHTMSHIWMVHVAHTKESPMWTRSATLFCMCDMTHSYVWHYVTLLYVRRDSFIRVTFTHVNA